MLVSDSLMFERGEPTPSDPHLSQIYGLALPFLKRGMPITPVQLENVTVANYLRGFKLLLLTYHGMKPLSPDVHAALAEWVKRGGVLVVCDDDGDPYNHVREWWNSDGRNYATPREHLFEQLGLASDKYPAAQFAAGVPVGKGTVAWLRENPAQLAGSADGETQLLRTVKQAAGKAHLKWRETNYLLLRRGPYLIGAGLDESIPGEPKRLTGRLVNLFDPELRVQESITLPPGSRRFLLDLNAVDHGPTCVLASACKALPAKHETDKFALTVEGVARTPAVLLLRVPKAPSTVTLAGEKLDHFNYSSADGLLWIRFQNESRPRELGVSF